MAFPLAAERCFFTLRSSFFTSLSGRSCNQPLVGGNFFESHRSACTQFLCTDAYLGTESKLCSISKTCWGIHVYAGCIHHGLKFLLCFLVARYDALAVSASVCGDVVERLVFCRHRLDTHLHTEPFGVPNAPDLRILFLYLLLALLGLYNKESG